MRSCENFHSSLFILNHRLSRYSQTALANADTLFIVFSANQLTGLTALALYLFFTTEGAMRFTGLQRQKFWFVEYICKARNVFRGGTTQQGIGNIHTSIANKDIWTSDQFYYLMLALTTK